MNDQSQNNEPLSRREARRQRRQPAEFAGERLRAVGHCADTLVTLGFLFNIGWTYFGPTLIILAGLGILFNSITKKE